MPNQNRDKEGSKFGPKMGQGRALVTKGSDLGDEKQSIDFRYFQAGSGGGKVGSTLVRQHLHPHVPFAHMALAHL